jgi:REP element-mobilizing transposase RayT
MTQSQPDFQSEHIPYGFLITFRAFGTWLHGRQGSVDRFHNIYGTPKLPRNEQRRRYNKGLLAQPPVKLSSKVRKTVESAIRETCDVRKWSLWAFNVRSNHVHTVVSANAKPDSIRSAFKANATRTLREAGYWREERSPWARKGSKRYLWTEQDLINAIAYVLYDQGEPLP